MRTIRSFDELSELATDGRHLYVRYSRGPDADLGSTSIDYESGLRLPGLSANPLHPECWWTRPVEDWLARQISKYVHLRDDSTDHRVGWILAGTVVARGPDNEPLLDDVEPVALVDDALVEEAKRRYRSRFEVGRQSVEPDPRRA